MPREDTNPRNQRMAEEHSFAALDTRVSILATDIDGLNNRIDNLDAKFDKVMSGFAGEFRAAIAGLSTQFSERNKTPWGVLISGMGVILTVVTLLGHQTLSPISETLQRIGDNLVPRKEIEFRHEILERRLTALESELSDLRKREFEKTHQQLDALQRENYLLKYPTKQ